MITGKKRGFCETFDDKHKTKLSSAGLVYKHFGREVILSLLAKSQVDEDVEKIYEKTYNASVLGGSMWRKRLIL